MDISRKTDYALRMLAMLAEGNKSLLSVRTAAEAVDVPYSFARSIQHGLVQAGIVESLRGVRGGMRLRLKPSEDHHSTDRRGCAGPARHERLHRR